MNNQLSYENWFWDITSSGGSFRYAVVEDENGQFVLDEEYAITLEELDMGEMSADLDFDEMERLIEE